MRILYVEDNPANLFLIKRVAKMGDHEVINLIDGEEALRKIDLIKPDLILMDIQLAGQLTGLDVVRKLRQDGLTIPIVAVTAYAMVGDRETDMQFAANLGVKGFKFGASNYSWAQIAHILVDAPRTASIERITKETKIRVNWNLDRAANPVVATGLGFFDHMLEQLGKHSGTALELSCAGDLHIDEHHTVEDSALALGQALKQALGDKRGIARYSFSLPMDETDASALLDLSGRPYFVFEGKFPREMVGDLATELVPHFFRSICETAGMNLHLKVQGDNAHHMVEACFKVFARVLGEAIKRSGNELPSTKGVL